LHATKQGGQTFWPTFTSAAEALLVPVVWFIG